MKYNKWSQDSFTARGTGFCYRYSSSNNCLGISDKREKCSFVSLKFDQDLSKDPFTYVRHLDKANKIKALSFSNNNTINLARTMTANKVSAILKGTARTSLYAHNLTNEDFRQFSKIFSTDTSIKDLRIRKISSKNKSDSFFAARMHTMKNRVVHARSCNLSKLMKSLSDTILHDIVILETHNQAYAHNLLKISMTLNTLSYILDHSFVPENMLNTPQHILGQVFDNTGSKLH